MINTPARTPRQLYSFRYFLQFSRASAVCNSSRFLSIWILFCWVCRSHIPKMCIRDRLCAMTLSQSQPVTAVSLTAEGTPIPDMAYYPSRLVTKSSDLNIPVRMFTLYFPDKQATGLLAEYRLMPLEDGADYTVVSELLAGTSDFENKINIIPQGTKINSVTTDNGL